jgi:hypothetical protein
MDPFVNPSFPILHRFGSGKLFLLQILMDAGEPVLRRKLSDAMEKRLSQNKIDAVDRETIITAVRRWLDDLNSRGFVESLTWGYWSLTEHGRGFAQSQSLNSSTLVQSSADVEKIAEAHVMAADCEMESTGLPNGFTANLPFTPRTIEDLVLPQIAGRSVKRGDLLDAVMAAHLKRGGIKPTANALWTLKKSLSNLEKRGLAKSTAGYWTASKELPIIAPAVPAPEIFSESTAAPETEVNISRTIDSRRSGSEPLSRSTEKESGSRKLLGEGSQKVYVYYYENDRKAAISEGKTTWDVKVGKTSGDVDARVKGQGAATARSRLPIIALEIRTQNADLLESALHSILKFCGLHIRKDGGSEWFEANPFLVESIYHHLRALESLFQ